MRIRLVAGCLASLVGCSSSDSAPPTAISRDDVVAFSHAELVIPTETTVGGATNWTVVDTGSPDVVLDPAAFPGIASLDSSGGGLATLTVGGQTLPGIATLAAAQADDKAAGETVDYGLLGFSSLSGHVAAFDYQNVAFTLDPASPPAGLEAAVTFPFALEGGGVIPSVTGTLPRTRVIIPVTVEGVTYSMMLDTGATALTVSETLWKALTADGRPTSSTSATGISGTTATTQTRARSVVAGGVERDAVLAFYDPDFAVTFLGDLSADVGQTIDGSLGGSFLAAFYTTIDYPDLQVSLAKYTDTSYLLDSAVRLGITTHLIAGKHLVTAVSGDAATKGIAVGDEITAIDGVPVGSIGEIELTVAFLGTYAAIGTTKQVTLGSAATLASQTIAVALEDQLPLPPVAMK